MLLLCLSVAVGVAVAVILLHRAFLERHQQKADFSGKQVRLCAVMGSGGHTTEMLLMLGQLKDCCPDRFYVIADTDKMSERKVREHEEGSSGSFQILKIARSREVGQSYVTAVFSTIFAVFESARIVWTVRPDVVLTNGPGTAVPICMVSFVLDLFRIADIRIHFVESYCRVKSLSLTGLILYYLHITDSFIVQWKDVHNKYPRSQFPGRLC
ncbi:hypothetical protein QR680_009368 [Steinernema hermaphroditum]|uniref:UDP-N-acetylglucosamine transferase subunit ALG14 n=1 Tax=Steinernema hermaphroditum TaxID=289476 RepID=A0AA39ILB0_9BILA|nr:hypothetical protein QR680_009368 [Steinernema hermaphroditum]